MRWTFLLFLFLPALPAAAALPAQVPGGPVITAGLADGGIVLDGVLDEPANKYAGVIPNLTEQDPEPGQADAV